MKAKVNKAKESKAVIEKAIGPAGVIPPVIPSYEPGIWDVHHDVDAARKRLVAAASLFESQNCEPLDNNDTLCVSVMVDGAIELLEKALEDMIYLKQGKAAS